MAESNKRRIADPIDLNDEDPFAELTRIMGFDPRLTTRSQPANEPGPAVQAQKPLPAAAPAAAKPVAIEPAPAVEAVAHDDFGIDLEKELMGEFADLDPEPATAPPAQPVAAIQPDDDVDMPIDDDFEDAFAASLEEHAAPVAVAAEPSPAAGQAAQPYAESHDDDAAFDDAFAVETGDELDLASEFELDDLDLSEPHLDEAPAEPELPAAASVAQHTEAPAVPVADALAEVDMDFSSAFDEVLRADGDTHGREMAVSPAPEPVYEPAYRAAEPVVAADDPLDLSLEDELNAMLDDAHAEPEAATFAPEPAPSAPPHEDDSRWSALEADDEEPAPIVAAPVAPAYRRPFIDPAIVGRLASFKAVPPPAPQAATEPEEDLDDLLDAMEHEVHPDEHASAEPQYQPYVASPAVERAETAYAHDGAAPAADAYDGYDEEASPADYDPAPDVETIDVPETAVAVADDLDIPELAYERDEPASPAYDDLDSDYPKAFAEPAVAEEPVNQTLKNTAEEIDFDTDFDALYRSGTAFETKVQGTPSTQGYAATASADYDYKAQSTAFDEYDDTATASPAARDRFVDLDFDNDVEEEIALPGNMAHETRAAPQRRGLLIAAVVGGVALLGGAGALALSFGNGSGADAPVVVKADSGPVKVKPENPGGTTVPNQDNKVYDAVKGADGATAAPAQDKLVTTSEEPVDMAAVDKADETTNNLPGVTDNNLPGVMDEDVIVPKAEDRIDPAANTDDAAAENVAITPRKVKTMVVRADGTLAPREDPAPSAPIAAAPAETASTEAPAPETEMAAAAPLQPAVPAGDETGAVNSDQPAEPTFQSPGADPVPVKTVKTNTVTATEQAAADATASVPDTGPAVESRPAEQPVDVVGEVKPEPVAPEQVASANVEPAAIATGSWSVQIASQPSAESAKSTYEDLAKRYGGVIGGRGVNIVKADIAGKGTYWRVRVPAQSRNDAIKLCTDYKSAGGNCFVSK
jgi:hypothetical protein